MAFRNTSFLRVLEPSHQDSKENTMEMNSSGSEQYFLKTGLMKDVSLQDGRTIIEDIVNNIFDAQKGYAENQMSSSQCSMSKYFEESVDIDPRLKRWQDALRDRAAVQMKICRKTGKRPAEMLLNMPTTVEQRNKGNIVRLMDYAERMNPTSLSTKKVSVLPEHFDYEQCMYINELQETLPRPEMKHDFTLEINGLPKVAVEEMMGELSPRADWRSKWLDSKVLAETIERKRDDIERVIEFYPDVQNLQIVNKAFEENMPKSKEKDIRMLRLESLKSISSSTLELGEEEQAEQDLLSMPSDEATSLEHAIKINDVIFALNEKNSAKNVDWKIDFKCEPYQRQRKQVLHMENLSTQLIVCTWMNSDYYERQPYLLAPTQDTFLFDHKHFVLPAGAVHAINVVFQPDEVCVVKQRWDLHIFPPIFCNRRDAFVLKLRGKCIPPQEYVRRTDNHLSQVIDNCMKCNVMGITALQAGLAPLLEPIPVLCPYERIYDDREKFNAENIGYHCERYDDLETLKGIYNKLKKPREPQWDFGVESIKALIMRHPDFELRKLAFEQLVSALDALRCSSFEQVPFDSFEQNAERDRSCFIYVRGAIANGIEEWEDLVLSLEQNCLKSELSRFYAQLDGEQQEQQSEPTQLKPWLQKLRQENPELYVLQQLRRNKFYRDSLYMHTYTHLCDMAENLVSIITSTEYI